LNKSFKKTGKKYRADLEAGAKPHAVARLSRRCNCEEFERAFSEKIAQKRRKEIIGI
jgi:hypothetical protein